MNGWRAASMIPCKIRRSMLNARAGYAALILAFFAAAGVILMRGRHVEILLLAFECLLLAPALWLAHAHPNAFPRSWRIAPPPIAIAMASASVLSFAAGFLILRRVAGGDEASYLFQARIFRAGMLAAQAPADIAVGARRLPEFFHFLHHVIANGRWFSQYPPLWPLTLTIGGFVHAEWLLNPLFAASYLYFGFRIGELLYGRAIAAAGMFLLAISPALLHYAGGLLSHASCATALAASFYCCLLGSQRKSVGLSILAVVLLGLGALIRPFTAFCFGVVIVPLSIAALWRKPRLFYRYVAGGAVAATLAAGAFFWYNVRLEGGLFAYGEASEQRLTLNPHVLLDNLQTAVRWSLESTFFYMTPLLGLLAVAVLFLERDPTSRRNTYILAAPLAALVVGHLFVTSVSSAFYGERYYYEAFFALALLGARAIFLLSQSVERIAASPAVLVPLLCVAVIHWTHYLSNARSRTLPGAIVLEAAQSIHESNIVLYLPPSLGRNLNLNEADWQHAPIVYLEDPGPEWRGPVAAALERPVILRIEYDSTAREARVVRGP